MTVEEINALNEDKAADKVSEYILRKKRNIFRSNPLSRIALSKFTPEQQEEYARIVLFSKTGKDTMPEDLKEVYQVIQASTELKLKSILMVYFKL